MTSARKALSSHTLGLTLAASLTACASLTPNSSRLVRSQDGVVVSVAEAAAELAKADVVFLGEEHDSDAAHALQLALTEELLALRGEVAISLEMFERDAQRRLDLYLTGAVDEEFFLAGARPWPNYREHYRPAIELAKTHGLDVLAANVYRPIAKRVGEVGLDTVMGDPWAATQVDARPRGAYFEKFARFMRTDPAAPPTERAQNFYAAQAIKDDTMAESITTYLAHRGEGAPLVVHWCGKFHSDEGLGTVERVLARRPDLRVAVVSTLSGPEAKSLDDAKRRLGAFLMLVP